MAGRAGAPQRQRCAHREPVELPGIQRRVGRQHHHDRAGAGLGQQLARQVTPQRDAVHRHLVSRAEVGLHQRADRVLSVEHEAGRRADAALELEAGCSVPAPTFPSATAPPAADSMACRTCSSRT